MLTFSWNFDFFKMKFQLKTQIENLNENHLPVTCFLLVSLILFRRFGEGEGETFEAAYGDLVVVYPGSCYSWGPGLLPLLLLLPSLRPLRCSLISRRAPGLFPMIQRGAGERPPTRPPAGEPLVRLLLRAVIHFCLRLRSLPGPILQPSYNIVAFNWVFFFFFAKPSEIDGRLKAEFLFLFILFSLPFKAQLLILMSFPPLLSSLLLFHLFSFPPAIIFHWPLVFYPMCATVHIEPWLFSVSGNIKAGRAASH